MEVKCPKCRFRYVTDTSIGLTEIACACPRCGTPFVYVISTNDDKAPLASEVLAESNKKLEEVQNSHISSEQELQRTLVDDNTSIESSNSYNVSHEMVSSHIPLSTSPINRQLKKKPKYYIYIALFLILVIVVYAIRTCNRRVYYDEKVNVEGVEVVSSRDSSSVSSNYSDDHSISTSIPNWLLGNWSVHTDYGVITLRISDGKIAETSGGRTSYGTFIYETGRLVCNFGDGQNMYYKVNEANRSIDAGNGMWMSKSNE